MLTEFGKVIRKIRLDKGEILKNMAERLGVSSSFLSSVENGRKDIPEKWLDQIVDFYNLNEKEKEDLEKAFIVTKKNMPKVESESMGMISSIKKEAAFVFARSFEEMSDETAQQILKMLKSERRQN